MIDQQQPDTQPGNYYVTVVDGKRFGRLLGPFVNDHAGALAWVDRCRKLAEELDARAFWYSYGTARYANDRPGALNDKLPWQVNPPAPPTAPRHFQPG